MNANGSVSGSLTLAGVLDMPAIAAGEPELLTPSAPLEVPVRWAHVIGVPHPGNMLYGGELVLSTLAGISENHPDPAAALHEFVNDLDYVGASALMVELFSNSRHLISAIREVATEREKFQAGKLPIFLFRREVRFVRITESVQRDLMVNDLEVHSETLRLRDPLGRATTNLLDDLASSMGLLDDEASERAAALGMPSSAGLAEARDGAGHLTALIFRVDSARNVTNQHPQVLSSLIRAASHNLRLPAIVGNHSGTELAVVLSQNAPERFCAAVRDEAARRRSYEIVPNYTVGVGTVAGRERVRWSEIPAALKSAAAVADAAARLSERGSAAGRRTEIATSVRDQGFWRVADLGLAGLLVQLVPNAEASSNNAGWFLDHYLALFQGEDGQEMRDLVEAQVAVGENKTELAKRLNISRPTLYGRIQRCEEAIGGPLSGERLTILYSVLLLDRLGGSR